MMLSRLSIISRTNNTKKVLKHSKDMNILQNTPLKTINQIYVKMQNINLSD